MKYCIAALLLLLLCYCPIAGQCQELLHEKRIHYKFNFLGLYGGLEYPLNNFWTINGELGAGLQPRFRWINTNGFGTIEPYVLVTPFVKVDSRFYINFKERQAKGQTIKYLSGDYFSIFGTQIIPTKALPIQWQLGINYGMQRHVTRHMYWGVQVGAYKPFVKYVSKTVWPYFRFELGLIY